MQKVDRVKLLLDFKKYNELKDYFRKESYWSKNVVLRGTFNNGYLIKVLLEQNNSSYGKYNSAKLSIILMDEEEYELKNIDFIVNRISQVVSLFTIDYNGVTYLINIDKDVLLTQETAISRLNIVKWNSLNYDYIKNLILFNDFNNDMELLETTFAVLNGLVDNIRNENISELTELLIEKFEYYGYCDDDAIETTEVDDDDTLDKVLSNLVGNLLAELYYPTNTKYRLNQSNMKDYVYNKAYKYILLLVTKGLIPER